MIESKPPSPFSRLIFLIPAVLLSALPSLHAQTPGNYTYTQILDSNTPVPGDPGMTFTGLSNTSDQIVVIDGGTVAFTLVEFPSGGISPSSYSVWSISTSGGTPTRLADTTTPVPGGSLGAFTELQVRGIGGGMVVFQAEFSGGVGLYAVPTGGGTVVKLVDTSTLMPNSTVNFGFQQYLQSVAVHGAQVLFAADDGYYFVPVTGGAITRFGDGTTPVLDDVGNKYFPNDFAGVGGSQQADFGGGTVAFLPTYTNDFTELFTGPITGLVANANGIADDATFIAGTNTPVPDGSGAGFDEQSFDAFVDDGGTPVFFGAATDGSSYGLFAYVNGVIAALADSHTVIAGQANPLSSIYGGQKAIAVSGGQAYFRASITTTGNDALQGIFAVPVTGGPVVPVVTSDDTPPGISDGKFNGTETFFGGVSGGKVVFIGSGYSTSGGASVSGIFLATPTGNTPPPANPLLLSTHTGGNTGPVTVTATIVPGGPTLSAGVAVKLAASGLADIGGGSVTVSPDGTSLTATIDLNGKAPGTYDFVVSTPDGTILTEPAAFTVETATGPSVYADLLGRSNLRAGKAQPYTIVVGNRGDVDAAMVPVYITFPNYFTCKVVTALTTPPQPSGLPTPIDFSQVPLTYATGDLTVLPLIVGRVPAGSVATIQVLFTCPDLPQYAHVGFNFGVAAGEPLLDAATGLPPDGSDASSVTTPDGKHVKTVGLFSTCLAGIFNLAVDCLSTFYPPLKAAKCAPAALLYFETTYASLASDNASPELGYVSLGQVEVGAFSLILQCLDVFPGVGTIINAIQCGVDTVLLYENCIQPFLMIPGQTITSGDPNDLSGSPGDGSAAHYLTGTGSEPLRYAVYFENEDTASAPAQSVTVTNPLDANMDLATFQLGPIAFGSTVLQPPDGAQNYSTVVDLRPATDLLVRVTAALNAASRTLTYSFASLDPTTGQPTTDPTAGFLPPDTAPPAGDGFAIFYVKPKAGLPTGTVIDDQASIVFDANAAIATPTWVNTLDNDAPVSQVTALPAKEKTAQIVLQLTSHDTGSGVRFFNLFVSEDGGGFAPLVRNAPGPSVTYNAITGHAYGFFSQAVDGAGNIEPLKTIAEASTKVRGADLIGAWKGDVTEKTTGSGRVKLSGKLKVTNQSPNKATGGATVVRLYLSDDDTFDADDTAIGTDAPLPVLAPGASDTLSFKNVKVPKSSAASGKYVIAVINPDSNIKETDHANNAVVYGPLP